MEDDAQRVAVFVDAAARALAMPLDPERRASVALAMARLAEFAADVASVPLADDIEVAGVFVP